MKELDLVLTPYLKLHYQIAPKDEKTAFQQLLALEDPVLSALLFGTNTRDNHNQQYLIKKLRRLIDDS
jgi:succinate dehydrogenase flavin-adding protein (antitoxin of CptAB toxin-antitoxin module)